MGGGPERLEQRRDLLVLVHRLQQCQQQRGHHRHELAPDRGDLRRFYGQILRLRGPPPARLPTSSPRTPTAGITIWAAGWGNALDGGLAEVQIYGRAWRPTPVAALYDNGQGLVAKPVLSDAVAVYHLGDGLSTFADSSGSSPANYAPCLATARRGSPAARP